MRARSRTAGPAATAPPRARCGKCWSAARSRRVCISCGPFRGKGAPRPGPSCASCPPSTARTSSG
ncbi:50S ribosomal protein L32 [Streptomyces sp. NPDC021608]|uniref:50S ribosomal protein L32 n=1 Tax=Streptomyces sp. NPDC021608 TaxID=3154903 RepID=UPI0033E37D64